MIVTMVMCVIGALACTKTKPTAGDAEDDAERAALVQSLGEAFPYSPAQTIGGREILIYPWLTAPETRRRRRRPPSESDEDSSD